MLTRLLLASAIATLAVSGVDARLRAQDIDDFSVQGLEQLESRYGAAFPGYAGANVNLGSNLGVQSGKQQQQQQQLLGLGQQSLLSQLPLDSAMYQNMASQAQQLGMQRINMNLGVGVAQQQQQPINLGSWQAQQPLLQQQQVPQLLQQQQVPQNWAQQWSDIGTDQLGMGAINDVDVQQQFGNIGMMQQQPQQIIGQQLLGNVGLQQQRMQQQQQPQWNLGMSNVDMVNLQQPVSLAQIPQIQRVQQSTVSSVMPNYQAPLITPQQQQTFGGIGSFGAGVTGGASKKTTTAQPIYAQSMVVPKIITQPIYRPHSVTQPILQQQLIQQPIVETRQVIQPVIRRIITQPIIRPEIYESTTIQPTLKTETVVQPHIVQQTVVTPQLQNEYSEQQPIQEKAKTQVQPAQVQAVQSAKKNAGAGGLGFGNY